MVEDGHNPAGGEDPRVEVGLGEQLRVGLVIQPLHDEQRGVDLEDVANAEGDAGPGWQEIHEVVSQEIDGESDGCSAEPEYFVVGGPLINLVLAHANGRLVVLHVLDFI